MANSKTPPSDLQMRLLQAQTRRHFLQTLGSGLGTLFIGTWSVGTSFVGTSIANYAGAANSTGRSEASTLDFTRDASSPLSALPPQFAAKVRRVIYLHMAGAPSQLELFE